MKIEDLTIRRDEKGKEGITRTCQSGLHKKHHLAVPKMFQTNLDRCPFALFKLYLSRGPLNLRNNGSFYLSVIVNPTSDILYKVPMEINTMNNPVRRMAANSPLQTLVKTLKQNKESRLKLFP